MRKLILDIVWYNLYIIIFIFTDTFKVQAVPNKSNKKQKNQFKIKLNNRK